MRDLGTLIPDESVTTVMGGIVSGKIYELTLYTMTALSNTDGTGSTYYSGTYKTAYDYQVGSNLTQEITNIGQEEWLKTKIYFIGDPDEDGNMTFKINLGQRSAFDANPANEVLIESLHIAVQLNALELLDTDGDGVEDIDDLDDDNDGILDTVEAGIYAPLGDEDDDGLPNFLDTRDDGNGGDSSTTDYTDANGDGVPDVYDFDNDGIPNHLDLDSDNDGIPDNIEAQTTAGYIAPNSDTQATYIANNGVNSAYLGGLTPVNSDSATVTDNPDYLDLDSDEDNVSDTIEANLSLSGNVGENGLDNTYDNGDDYTDVNGAFDNTQTDNFPDDGNNAGSGGDVDWRDILVFGELDTDGDGIPNSVDIDDDNDGILDSDECDVLPTIYVTSITEDNTIGSQGDITGNTPDTFGNFNSVNDVLGIGFGQVIPAGTTVLIRASKSNNNNKVFQVEQADASNNALTDNNAQTITPTTTATDYSYILTSDTQYLRISMTVEAGNGVGRIHMASADILDCSNDTDSDGIPNYLDLDSDNDGIPDNIEAQPTGSYIPPSGSVGDNGLYNIYGSDDNSLSATVTAFTIQNTDGTGDPDYIDTDSDDDGTDDRTEANLSLSGTVGINGLDNNYDNGDNYTDTNGSFGTDPYNGEFPDNPAGGEIDWRDATSTFADNDNDGIIDADDWDDDNDGITDAQELCGTDFSTTLTVNSTITIEINFDGWASEVTSSITGPGAGLPTNVGGYSNGDNFTTYSYNATVAGNYTFTIFDAFNDGMDNSNGGADTDGLAFYRILVDGVQIYQSPNYTDYGASDSYTPISIVATLKPFTCLTADPNADSDNDGIVNYKDADYATANGSTIVNGVVASLDLDGDGIINSMDLDADGDGIPDNIEAQSTTGYTPPNGTFDGNGVDTAYGSTGITAQNTDGTGSADYLDTDADDDGLLDNVEAGLTLTGNVGNNGLDNAYDNGDNFTDVNGSFDNSQANNFPDADNDVFNGGDVDYRDTTFTGDNDDDGINDEVDLDDDNDGIVDALEYGSCTPVTNIFNWETLYSGNPNGAAQDDGDDPLDNATQTVSGVEISLSRSSTVDSNSNYRVNDFVTTDGSYSLVQQASVSASSRNTFNFNTPIYGLSFTIYDVDGASGETIRDNVQVILIKEDGGSYELQPADYTVNGSSNEYDGNNTFSGNNASGNGNIVISSIPEWVVQLQVVYTNTGTGDFSSNQNIAIGNLSFCIPLDSDGDGVFDFRDLDSDNDGIPDNIEAQDTQDYIAPSGSYNVNGIDLAYGTGLTPQNTDGTGEADYLDLDSDDDGTNDIVESGSGLTDGNNDGRTDGTVGANGLDNTLDNGDDYSDVNGSFDNTQTDNFTDTDGDVNNNGGDLDYRDTTNGLDTDGDGIVDSIDIDDDNDGILDTVEDAGNNDVDGDGIINSLDLDSDNDGIPDNVEAQPTTTYVAPTGSVGANGLYDIYENNDTAGATSFSVENTDGTDNPDYLDTDSDNDGTFDISENHVSDTTDASLDANTGGTSDGTPDGMIDPANFVDTDGDGLADIFEGSDTNDGYDSNDEIDTPSTELPDVDSDVNTTGDVDYRDDTVDPITPGVVGNTLWLRADIGVTGGSTVTLWEDQTASNADFSASGGDEPDNTVTANNLNFNPVVTFTPSNNDFMSFTGNLNPRSLYIVYNDISTNSFVTPFTNDDTGNTLGHGETDDTGLYSASFTPIQVRTGSGRVSGLNTVLTSHDRPDNYELISNVFIDNIHNASHTYYVGRDRLNTDRVINGSIAEIMVFSDEHTGVKRQQIESYLAIKYGFTLSNNTDNDGNVNEVVSGSINEGDYILADQGTKVWDSEATYHNDVAGIGRDDQMVLNQKQSKSVNSDAIITIGLTSIAATNAANANSFTTNKDFLMWGNNNGVVNTVTETELICAPEKTLGRTWKIVENGSVGSVQIAATKSTIDGALTTPNTMKVLKVADDASFTTNVAYVPLTDTSINSEDVYAASYDFDGTKYFTYSEINGIFWTGSNSSWAGGNGPSNEASTVVADTDKVMVIDAQGTGNHATLTDDAKVECVWVKTDSKLMVADAKYLEFDEDFILDGEVRLIGDGQLIQTHVGASNVQGSGKLYRDQKSQIAVAESIYRYNYWSSPVVELNKDTYRVGEVMKDGTTPTSESSQPRDINFVGGANYNGSTSDPITIANYWIWSYPGGTTRYGWVQNRETGEIQRGLGFIMKSTGRIGGQNFTFEGTPNDGSITFNLAPNTVSLLGNPYASNLDADEFITTNSEAITGTLYFWEHTGAITQPGFVEGHGKLFYIGGYSQRNLAMGVSANTVVDGTVGIGNSADYHTPSKYISVAQGFFVSTSATGGTVRFENAQRGYSSDTYFFKHPEKQQAKTDKEAEKLPVLKLGFDYYNENNAIIHRQAGISFKRGNSTKFNYGYDSDAFDVQPTDIYWEFPNEDKKLIIAGIQEINNQLEVPIAIEIDTDKSTFIMIDEVENIEHQISLVDKVENKTYDLISGSVELNLAKGSYKDRFYLTFYKQAALGIDDEILSKNLSVFTDNGNKELVIKNNNNLTVKNVEIHNILGQTLQSWKINNNSKETRLDLNTFSSAVYIVKVKTDKGILSKKIIFQK